MARILIAFIRHGAYHQPAQVPSAHLPHALCVEGEQQARRGAETLAAKLHAGGWQLVPTIDASCLLRAWQTAGLMASELQQRLGCDLRVEEFEALTERSVGSASNLTEQQIEDVIAADPRYPALETGWKLQPDFRLPFPGAESLRQAGNRVFAHVTARVAELRELPIAVMEGGTILKVFVGHGGSFRYAAVAMSVLDDSLAPHMSMQHCEPLIFESLASGEWRHHDGDWKVRRLTARRALASQPPPASGGD